MPTLADQLKKLGQPSLPEAPISKPKQVFKPLSNLTEKLPKELASELSIAMSQGLAKVRELKSTRPDAETAYFQSRFCDIMLDQLFNNTSLDTEPIRELSKIKPPTKLQKLRSQFANKNQLNPSNEKLLMDRFDSAIIQALSNNSIKRYVPQNIDISIPDLNLPESIALIATYLEQAQPFTTDNTNGGSETYYTGSIPKEISDKYKISNAEMRIRATTSDLRGHNGGKGHLHLEIKMHSITKNQDILINIHIYPNLNQFSSVL
jgi:hypothetical protein